MYYICLCDKFVIILHLKGLELFNKITVWCIYVYN